jgi:SAM-dependent MidA family methyltransferase
LGRGGDFITAPEISQLFGEMIGIWAMEHWIRLGQPSTIHLVECGAGRGTLMADLLRLAQVQPEFLKAVSIHLVEISPTLQAKQAETLKNYSLTWHDSLANIPQDAPILVIGNEFLDALPIRQFMLRDGQWFERMVGGNDKKRLEFLLSPSPYANALSLSLKGEGLREREGKIFESSFIRENFITDMSQRIKTQTGAGLMIDYGHLVSGFGDTFQAIINHQFCSVLENCGQADLTSHVDFSVLKKIAEDSGVTVTCETQADFLKRMGIVPRAEQLIKKSASIENGFHRLIDDDKMGRLFKVMECQS